MAIGTLVTRTSLLLVMNEGGSTTEQVVEALLVDMELDSSPLITTLSSCPS